MTHKKKILLSLIGLSFISLTAACAHRRHVHGAHGKRAQAFISARVDDALDEVDATSQQRAQVHTVKNKLFQDFKVAHADRNKTKQELLMAWKSDKPDVDKLHELTDKRVNNYRSALHETVNAMVEVHKVLEKEQRMKLATLMEEKMQRYQRD